MEPNSAAGHIPAFITAPGETDVLAIGVTIFLIGVLFLVGVLYFRLHALPEHMAHRTNRVQLEIVAVLALISLFTHNHLFWIAALLLALVQFPDFSTPISSIAQSLARLAGRYDRDAAAGPPAEAGSAAKAGAPAKAEVPPPARPVQRA